MAAESLPDRPAERREPRTTLRTRSKARKHALDILFAAELRGISAEALLAEQIDAGDPQVREFTRELVRGVSGDIGDIDAQIRAALAPGWSLERMPRVDRVAARLGTFELRHTDVPPEIAIAEAVALAGDLSTDDSPAFLNGLLSRIARTEPDAGESAR